MSPEQFLIQECITGAAALGTITVAILATWGEPIRRRLVGTELELSLLDPAGEAINLAGGQAARYYHVVVKNRRPHAVATNAHVVVTKLIRATGHGQFPQVGLLQGITGALPLIRQHQHTLPRLATIGPDANYDLVNVIENVGAAIQLVFAPNNLDASVRPNTRVVLELVAVCDQMQSKPLYVDIAWDGQWSPDTLAMAQHFVVKAITQLP
jgi:hypothetical protein